MPSNLNEPLTQKELKQLVKLLAKFQHWIHGEQPLAAQIVRDIQRWAEAEVED
jgi:hypothetical protein